jgi:hypothetical protein
MRELQTTEAKGIVTFSFVFAHLPLIFSLFHNCLGEDLGNKQAIARAIPMVDPAVRPHPIFWCSRNSPGTGMPGKSLHIQFRHPTLSHVQTLER